MKDEYVVMFERGDFLGFGGCVGEWPEVRKFPSSAAAHKAARGYDLPYSVVTVEDYKAGRI